MAPRLAQIRRHPIKGIGTELLEHGMLEVGRPLSGDRAWAVLPEGQSDTGTWQPRRNFLQSAFGPELMAVTAKSGSELITLHHPTRPDITLNLEADGPRLIDWVRPLWPENQPPPARLIRAPDQGMSDADFASVSIMSHASLRALSDKLGQWLDPRRFRGNLWVDGLAPWEEFDWIGRRVAIGSAELEIVARIERCRATEANPETGLRDAEPVKALHAGWGHIDFGVIARVTEAGRVNLGDALNIRP